MSGDVERGSNQGSGKIEVSPLCYSYVYKGNLFPSPTTNPASQAAPLSRFLSLTSFDRHSDRQGGKKTHAFGLFRYSIQQI